MLWPLTHLRGRVLPPSNGLLRAMGGVCTSVWRGGGWHDAWMYCCLQLAAPIGLWPLPLALSLNPFPTKAAAPIGAPPLPLLTSLLTPPFPWSIVPTEPPDCPCSTALCRLHRGGQRPSPLARGVQADTPQENPPQQGTLPLAGSHNNLQPALSRAPSSLWRAHPVSPHPPPPALGLWCVYGVSIPSRGMGATRGRQTVRTGPPEDWPLFHKAVHQELQEGVHSPSGRWGKTRTKGGVRSGLAGPLPPAGTSPLRQHYA